MCANHRPLPQKEAHLGATAVACWGGSVIRLMGGQGAHATSSPLFRVSPQIQEENSRLSQEFWLSLWEESQPQLETRRHNSPGVPRPL